MDRAQQGTMLCPLSRRTFLAPTTTVGDLLHCGRHSGFRSGIHPVAVGKDSCRIQPLLPSFRLGRSATEGELRSRQLQQWPCCKAGLRVWVCRGHCNKGLVANMDCAYGLMWAIRLVLDPTNAENVDTRRVIRRACLGISQISF